MSTVDDAKKVDVNSITTYEDSNKGRQIKNELETEDFLELLTTELQYQDPMEPMKNNEMMSQMAQFTSLEQTESMNSAIETLNSSVASLMNYQQISQASTLIGKEVTIEVPKVDGDEEESTDKGSKEQEMEQITGEIEKVLLSAEGPQITINGEKYPASSIQEILG